MSKQLGELLQQTLETELGGVKVYETALPSAHLARNNNATAWCEKAQGSARSSGEFSAADAAKPGGDSATTRPTILRAAVACRLVKRHTERPTHG